MLQLNLVLQFKKQEQQILSAPESWNVYDTSNGLPLASVNKLIFFNNNLIAGTNLGLSIFDGTNWQSYLGLTNVKILDLLVDWNSLYILTPNKVYLYDGNTLGRDNYSNCYPTKIRILVQHRNFSCNK